jgi:RNase P subunit RPR2
MSEPDPVYTVASALQIGKHRLGPYIAALSCKRCHSILASVTELDGRTALVLFTREGYPCLAFEARLVCLCGEERMFYSMPMSAVRLGITDE